jgi:hypothetical protein
VTGSVSVRREPRWRRSGERRAAPRADDQLGAGIGESGQLEGLGDVCLDALAEDAGGDVHLGGAADDDNRRTPRQALHLLQHRPAVQGRQEEVEDGEVDAMGLQEVDRRQAVQGLLHPETLRLEGQAQHALELRVVVHDQDDVGLAARLARHVDT